MLAGDDLVADLDDKPVSLVVQAVITAIGNGCAFLRIA